MCALPLGMYLTYLTKRDPCLRLGPQSPALLHSCRTASSLAGLRWFISSRLPCASGARIQIAFGLQFATVIVSIQFMDHAAFLFVHGLCRLQAKRLDLRNIRTLGWRFVVLRLATKHVRDGFPVSKSYYFTVSKSRLQRSLTHVLGLELYTEVRLCRRQLTFGDLHAHPNI